MKGDAVSELIGLPEPPPMGESALPPGTFGGVSVLVTGGGTRPGQAIAPQVAPPGAAIVVSSRKKEHLARGPDPEGAVGARGGPHPSVSRPTHRITLRL